MDSQAVYMQFSPPDFSIFPLYIHFVPALAPPTSWNKLHTVNGLLKSRESFNSRKLGQASWKLELKRSVFVAFGSDN